ncbi:hydroxyneurosporene synthase [Chloroherpeton thalassium ATCC 35110]|uniref:Hydroxyneurosporene synthase n=1 Tax=Chloroherpeton thalassium (strain ATCC 35110 / GB-78) TaxID=517418 RepID=B3QYL8_CHLT3|nr:carotenoid 1,2-hydratase [Chloroherpeton thalassium]ACF13646.1 hydroxyneurosporene synthase [Chloroherpeton thalassium ATCC 35110]
MRISTSIDQDIWHDLKDAGSYEWWYFDAKDEDQNCSFVAVWYSGFAFSPYYINRYNQWKANGSNGKGFPNPLEHAAFSFNFYQNGNEVINFIKEGGSHLFESSTEKPYAKFEKNEFFYDETHRCYVLKLDFEMPSRKKSVKAEVRFRVCPIQIDRNIAAYSAGESSHSWVLVAPRTEVFGQFEIYDGLKNRMARVAFKGKGYHDHNYGSIPINTDIENWYWGRAHSHDIDLVYYIISYKHQIHAPFIFLMAIDKEEVLVLENRLQFSESQSEQNFFVPRYSKTLSLSNQELQFTVQHQNGLEIGPFYLRFESTFQLVLQGKPPIELRGISEFLHPDKVDSGVIRHLIKSKIWREDNYSVMYTLYNFFNRMLE